MFMCSFYFVNQLKCGNTQTLGVALIQSSYHVRLLPLMFASRAGTRSLFRLLPFGLLFSLFAEHMDNFQMNGVPPSSLSLDDRGPMKTGKEVEITEVCIVFY